jgi:hypothetical protein
MLVGSTLLGLLSLAAGTFLLVRKDTAAAMRGGLRATLIVLLALLGLLALAFAFVIGSCAFGSYGH